MPVPYNIDFELAIISKNQEDGLQILEQILPFFQPHYNLAVKLLPAMNETKDVPVVLQSIDYEDSYETYESYSFDYELEDFKSFKSKKIDDFLKCWSGLGYYNRAINFYKSVSIINKNFKGILPEDLSLIHI